jgi:hypothetical protein
LAIGKMSVDLTEAELTETLLKLLDTPDPLTPLLPRAPALLAAAVAEMVQIPEPVAEETASRLITAWADRARAGGPPALLDFIARTFVTLVGVVPFPPVERALLRALGKGSRDQCLAAAVLTRTARCASVELAEALTTALPQDYGQAGWPVDAALRELASSYPGLLPSRPGTLRWALRRNPTLLRRFLNLPAWRRIGLVLYGDSTGPEGMYRDSPLTPRILSFLEDDRDGKDLASEFRKALKDVTEEIRADALLALMALGEPMAAELQAAEPAAKRALSQFSRITKALETLVPNAIGPALESLVRIPDFLLHEPRGCDLVSALIDIALAFGGSPVQVLDLAKTAPVAARPRLLAEVWHCLLAGAQGDPLYNLAILIDTEGEALTSPPFLLAQTLDAAPASANGRWDRHQGWHLDRLAPTSPHGEQREVLASALDALAGLAGPFDFVRGWALIVLSPLLREANLVAEALALALGSLSDRFNARSETVLALAGSASAADLLLAEPGPALLAAIHGLNDPFLRLRALLRLAETDPKVREELLAPPKSIKGFQAWFAQLLRTSTTFPPLVREAITLSDPFQRAEILESFARLDEIHRVRWVGLAAQAAEQISDTDRRARTLARMAPHLPLRRRERLLLRALGAATRNPTEGGRAAETLDVLRSRFAVSPRLRRHFEHDAASLKNRLDQARARGLSAALLLTMESALGGSATPLVLGAILTDLSRELLIPSDVSSLWTALMDDNRRAAALTALRRHGKAGGLRLTAVATDVLDRCIAAGDLAMPTSLLSLLETPEPAALPALDRWLHHQDPGLRSRAALLVAERRGVSAKTVSGVLALLSDTDDRIRHRAALALHGDFAPGRRPLSAIQIGSAVLEDLARCWRTQRDQSPGVAKVIEWTFQRVEHDDSRALSTWARRLTHHEPGAPEAEVILGTIEHLHPAAEASFLSELRGGATQVQRALLRSTCRLLARDRLRDRLWEEIKSLLPALDPAAGSDSFLIDGPSTLVDALQVAWTDVGGQACGGLPERANRALAGHIHHISEAFGGDPVTARETLVQAGLASRLSGPRIRVAADRILASPSLLPPLVGWLCERLGRDVQDIEPFCPINSDLLALNAAVAERLPEEFRAAASNLSGLRPRLRDAAKLHDSFPGRRSALLLLASLRQLTEDVLDALHSGLNDVAPVQAATLSSLVRYRSAHEEVHHRLRDDLNASSPMVAMTAARLLASLLREAPPPTRAEAAWALTEAAASEGSRREVYMLAEFPPLKIKLTARLDQVFYEVMAELSGLTNPIDQEAQEQET